jgi:hypothetical protein
MLERAMLNTAKEFPLRPLIFIAHCFGGLVVLKVLYTVHLGRLLLKILGSS